MSGTGTRTAMRTPETLTVAGAQNSPALTLASYPATTPAQIHNMRLSSSGDGTPVYHQAPATVAGVSPSFAPAGSGTVDAVLASGRKKRGRPRKYAPDGSVTMNLTSKTKLTPRPATAVTTPPAGATAIFSSPVTPPAAVAVHPSPPSTQPPSGGHSGSPSPSRKKTRGRPPRSSTKKQHTEAMASAGFGFAPHIIDVQPGQDISAKIMSFSQTGPRAICILSAIGSVANVTIQQPATFGGTATYEGKFDILSLSGSFTPNFSHQLSGQGSLSISVVGPDGRVLGGAVAGPLTAAIPVQVFVGSFIPEVQKESKSINHTESLFGPQKLNPVGAAGAGSSSSLGTPSESSGGPGSPFSQSIAVCSNSNPQGASSMSWR